MKSILIISFSDIAKDPRVMRQIATLSDRHKVTVIGFGSKPAANIEFISIDEPPLTMLDKAVWASKLLLRMFESYYWHISWVKSAKLNIRDRKYDLYIANDLSALPLALKVASGGAVLFDAHEYFPRQFEDLFKWRLFFKGFSQYMCRMYIPRVSSMMTVCDGIASEYNKNYNILPKVVYNAPVWQGLSPQPVDPRIIRMIHHGAATPSRHLESMVEIMNLLDERFHLDFMLVETDIVYISKLRNLAKNNHRVRFVPPVSMPTISKTINKYDVGIYILPPVNFNHAHALPNKFFEFIQANLAVVIGPSTEMANIVDRYGCGVVTKTFEPSEMAEKLNALTAEDVYNFKVASSIAAKELGFENSADTLLSEVDRLLKVNK